MAALVVHRQDDDFVDDPVPHRVGEPGVGDRRSTTFPWALWTIGDPEPGQSVAALPTARELVWRQSCRCWVANGELQPLAAS